MESMNWVEFKKYMLEQERVWYFTDFIDLSAYIIYGIILLLLIRFIYTNYKLLKFWKLTKWILLRLIILFVVYIIFSMIHWSLGLCLCGGEIM